LPRILADADWCGGGAWLFLAASASQTRSTKRSTFHELRDKAAPL
jgi:hypothetical protein